MAIMDIQKEKRLRKNTKGGFTFTIKNALYALPCIFEVPTYMSFRNQRNYFKNATLFTKRMYKLQVATRLEYVSRARYDGDDDRHLIQFVSRKKI